MDVHVAFPVMHGSYCGLVGTMQLCKRQTSIPCLITTENIVSTDYITAGIPCWNSLAAFTYKPTKVWRSLCPLCSLCSLFLFFFLFVCVCVCVYIFGGEGIPCVAQNPISTVQRTQHARFRQFTIFMFPAQFEVRNTILSH